MSTQSQIPSIRNNDQFKREMRNLMITWGVCCCSSLAYLSMAYMLKRSILQTGLFPMGPEMYMRMLIGLGVLSGVMEGALLAVKARYSGILARRLEDGKAFVTAITMRTFSLLLICELPVALGFCLFLVQGDMTSVFGFGVVSMLLYAQAHPRSSNPAFPR